MFSQGPVNQDFIEQTPKKSVIRLGQTLNIC